MPAAPFFLLATAPSPPPRCCVLRKGKGMGFCAGTPSEIKEYIGSALVILGCSPLDRVWGEGGVRVGCVEGDVGSGLGGLGTGAIEHQHVLLVHRAIARVATPCERGLFRLHSAVC